MPILLCNPNNPTGLFISTSKIKELAAITQSTLFIDATYYFFSTEAKNNAFKKFECLDNTIYAYSLSKTFSAAGIRLGFLVGDKKIINMLRKVIDPFINYFSFLCLEKLLTEKEWNSGIKNITIITNNKKWLLNKLRINAKLDVLDTQTNFILIKSRTENLTTSLYDHITSNNIQLKLCEIAGVRYIRITIGTKTNCTKIMQTINGW